jgi:alkyldihydroxyacetonephosphate synthase
MSYAVWGWGGPQDEPTEASLRELAPFVEQATGITPQQPVAATPLQPLPASKRTLPPSLAHLGSTEDVDRARHGIGRAYRELVLAVRGIVNDVPDLVVRPRTEQDVIDVLDWASGEGVPVVPFGGGTSVVGGVAPRGLDGAVSLDLQHLSGLEEVDLTSRAVRLRAGTLGPDAEALLKPHGLTLRFYPQSFERSSVGGWVVTRAAGHFSTRLTHIDDITESVRAVTPTGTWQSRRLPGSGAGPSPDRALLGSEGTLGVVTEAWLRAQPRPRHRWAATFAAPDFTTGAAAVRNLVQAGLLPATCRLLDPVEAGLSGTLTTGEAALVLGLESLHVPLDAEAAAALEIAQGVGLRVLESGPRGEAGEAWRSTFVRAPFLRESLMLLGILAETFETAITWDRLDDLVSSVTEAVRRTGATVGCRFTHVYPDGAAPYFTVLAPARRGSEADQWDDLKALASEAILAAGGTITHHHAVGRDHRPWYDRQRPDLFAAALAATKRTLDPAGILNPGVLL